ncbi:MAG: hypothetical protein DCF19_17185 [Pseudanabaena frigida]|uniref:Uncharacterized protein n=1 Tax=Pseudanabaena frigida TaxID=945775 RepID=A0A2W4W0Y4_9CYAN|nr:MAG: hypothetical protein DCF19_17185 [Pseudanabaena frigida]
MSGENFVRGIFQDDSKKRSPVMGRDAKINLELAVKIQRILRFYLGILNELMMELFLLLMFYGVEIA